MTGTEVPEFPCGSYCSWANLYVRVRPPFPQTGGRSELPALCCLPSGFSHAAAFGGHRLRQVPGPSPRQLSGKLVEVKVEVDRDEETERELETEREREEAM